MGAYEILNTANRSTPRHTQTPIRHLSRPAKFIKSPHALFIFSPQEFRETVNCIIETSSGTKSEVTTIVLFQLPSHSSFFEVCYNPPPLKQVRIPRLYVHCEQDFLFKLHSKVFQLKLLWV